MLRADLNGENLIDLGLSTTVRLAVEDVAIDVPNGNIYWSTWNGRELWMADYDGQNRVLVFSGNFWMAGVALDLVNYTIYWVENDFPRYSHLPKSWFE